MSHLHKGFEGTWFVHNPEGLGEIQTIMSFHVHQLCTAIDIVQRCGQVELIALIQGRM